jgi:hypothetical protein
MAERTGTARGPRARTLPEEHGFSLDELKDWKKQIEKTVQDHPILSASIAVGTGVLIARLLKDALDDEGERKRKRRRRGGLLGSEIGRALMGSLATMAAAKLQETLLEGMQAEQEEEVATRPRRPRKQGRQATAKRARSGQRRRPPKVEE